MRGFTVIKPGLFTTVQDLGRQGFQQFGVVVSGAMDPFSLRVANLLVGNDDTEAGLEVTLMGPELMAESDLVIAICGGHLSPTVDDVKVETWRSFVWRKGSVLRFGAAIEGCRTYIAFAGGIEVPVVMGSKSTYVRGEMGGFQGRALQRGDAISIKSTSRTQIEGLWVNRRFSYADRPSYPSTRTFRVMRGIHLDRFSDDVYTEFFHNTYEVSQASDRMGYRLSGPPIQHLHGADIISDAVPWGGIQVPSDGQPIILMADRQTTGGYTMIAVVIYADLPLLAQMKPGDRMRFQEVTVAEAHQIYKEQEKKLNYLRIGNRLY
jgi:antagonist of KipI